MVLRPKYVFFMLPPRFQQLHEDFFLSPKDKLKKKRVKDDEDITKDKLNSNEGKVYPLLHILKVFD